MGIGTSQTGSSIASVNGTDSYQKWEFLYDPRIEQLRAGWNIFGGGGGGSMPATGLGNNGPGGVPGSNPGSGFGSGQDSGFGGGSGSGQQPGATPPLGTPTPAQPNPQNPQSPTSPGSGFGSPAAPPSSPQ